MTPGYWGANGDLFDDPEATVLVQAGLDIGLPVNWDGDGRVMCRWCRLGVDHQAQRWTFHGGQSLVCAHVEGAGGIIVEEPLFNLSPIFLCRWIRE